MSGGSPELRGPLLHNVSPVKRILFLEGLLSPERASCHEGLLFGEDVTRVQTFAGGDNEGKTMFRGKTLSLLSYKKKILKSSFRPEKTFFPWGLLSRGASSPEGPPAQRGSPTQGASCPEGPPAQSVSCPKRVSYPERASYPRAPAQGSFCPERPPVQKGLPTGGSVQGGPPVQRCLLYRGPPVQRVPPNQKEPPAQGASCPEEPHVQMGLLFRWDTCPDGPPV